MDWGKEKVRVSWVTIAMTTIAVCLAAASCDKLDVTVGAVCFEGRPEEMMLTTMSGDLPA